MNDLNNQGFQPKSESAAAERASFASYTAELLSLPPVNSNANAKLLRSFLVRSYPSFAVTFDELRLDY